MAYRARGERKIEILDAVIALAEAEGFGAARGRRVATHVGISPGNLHHLFESASGLKRNAFELYTERAQNRLEAENAGLPPMEQLVSYLATTALGESSGSRRLWSSAVDESANDPEFAEIYSRAAKQLLDRTADLLQIVSDGRLSRDQAYSAAARLTTFAVGITATGSASLVLPASDVLNHIHVMIGYELSVGLEGAGGYDLNGSVGAAVSPPPPPPG